jgi:hypothetical protein
MGEMVNGHKSVVTSISKKKSLSRIRHRCNDHFKMDLRDLWYDNVDWIHLAQNSEQ